ncbi:MAG: hypothetical protein ACYDCL_03525 [Myxococcales bacterium]
MKMSHPWSPRSLTASTLTLALVASSIAFADSPPPPSCTTTVGSQGSTRQFSAGSLIIPTDNCFQGDLAQVTVPRQVGDPTYVPGECAGDPNSNSVAANGARRVYGLLWLLLKAGIPVYWIINPDKNGAGNSVDTPDMTLGTCGTSADVVALVDPSLPASYCGLDALHPLDPPTSVSNQQWYNVKACTVDAKHIHTGSVPLTTSGSVDVVSYRGGPFVIDSTNAAQARDLMAWYFAEPPAPGTLTAPSGGMVWSNSNLQCPQGTVCATGGHPEAAWIRQYHNPWATNGTYLDTTAGGLGMYGTQNQFFDPGHHPLHWSDYTPSMMVPFYPSQSFTFDIGSHSVIWPCSDPVMCAYTTWDPLNPNGYVDPWAGTAGSGTTKFSSYQDQNAITYATVNVHQALVTFMAPVARVFNSPIQPTGLLAMTDPVHINTFRFYLEEAGLTFGPCNGPPGSWLMGNNLSPNPNGMAGMTDPGFGQDHFFDLNNYPFPSLGGLHSTVASTSALPVTCAEGLSTTDTTMLAANSVDDPVGGSEIVPGTTGETPSMIRSGPPFSAPNGGPYGQVLDLIAPEPAAIQGILAADGSNNSGCGAPAYQELWVPHWDAFLCSGPTTENCPLSAQSTCPGALAGQPGCPGQTPVGWAWPSLPLNSGAYPGSPVPLGSTTWSASGIACDSEFTGADGHDPYCPQLVQFTLDALQTYVWKGGNLFAECIGAASLEDVTMRSLLGQWGINQTITHFMTEWDKDSDGLAAYYPSPKYYSTSVANHPGGLAPNPSNLGNMGSCGSSGTSTCCIGITQTATVCEGLGSPKDLCQMNEKPGSANFPFGEPPASLAVGWAGAQVMPAPGTSLPNGAVELALSAPGIAPANTGNRAVLQFNAMGGQAPQPAGAVVNCCTNSDCASGGVPGSVCNAANCKQGVKGTCQDAVHLVWYTPPSAFNGDGEGNFPTGSLADPLLQVGDFYFQGVFGATESWEQGVRGNEGYAADCQYPDTYPLIRGLSGTCLTLNPDGSCQTVGNFDTNASDDNGPYYGDYWVYNHNSFNGEAGQVIYLGGDSYDGRPDGLRLIWSSMMDEAYSPSTAELARSSAALYQPTATMVPNTYHTDLSAKSEVAGQPAGDYLLQGTFVQQTLPPNATTIFNSYADLPNWAYPGTLGHFRQNDVNSANSCVGRALTGACTSAVGADSLTNQGSNAASFAGMGLDGTWNFWDTSGPSPVDTNNALLIDANASGVSAQGGAKKAPPGTDPAISNRVLFTQLYEKLPNDAASGGVGLHAVWLNPQNANYKSHELECALFPTSANCPGASGSAANNVACPDGQHCIAGPLSCGALCQVDSNGNAIVPTPLPISNATCSSANQCYAASSDVGSLLAAVADATGGPGCIPLLTDQCYSPGTPQVACLDKCWAGCWETCAPTSEQPPFTCSAGGGINIGNCAHDCAAQCNGDHGKGVGGADCGVGQANSPSSFRQLCYPSLGGIDHSTPVIVGPPGAIPEYYPRNPALPCTHSAKDGNCQDAHARPTVAYVGAADGFLHAIYVEDGTDACSHGHYVPGQEIWAFMPNQQLPLVRTNGSCAESLFVDGVPVVKDTFADLGDGTGPGWHTLLTMTEGVGGNHVFTLDVTDPMAPIGGDASGCTPAANMQPILDNARVVLWENGDPLDTNDFWPLLTSDLRGPNVTYQPPGTTANAYQDDLIHEGPGFPTGGSGLVQPSPGSTPPRFNHYMGGASSVFMGQLLGSGSQEDITYVAAQNSPVDAYGRSIQLPPKCFAGCNKKDFKTADIYGPQGEVVYAFESGTGIPKAQLSTKGSVIEHFTMQYITTPGAYRSDGQNDVPAPALGVTLSGRPETELLVIPDLDGQVWGLFPGTLAPYRTQTIGGGAPEAFPLFDLYEYLKGGEDFVGCGSPAQAADRGTYPWLFQGAPFANPAAYMPPGTCSASTGFNDPVVVLATGGVDWGPPASVVVALDVAPTNNNLASGMPGPGNDSAASPMPVGKAGCQPVEIATCQQDTLMSTGQCEGRVFGQPLVVGSEVLFTSSTGILTGVGSALPQQQGTGNIEALGASGCSAANTLGCGICQATEQTNDLAVNVGKVGSGLVAGSTQGGANGNVQVFSSSTTGIGTIQIQVTQNGVAFGVKPLLEQWWRRTQQRTP